MPHRSWSTRFSFVRELSKAIFQSGNTMKMVNNKKKKTSESDENILWLLKFIFNNTVFV